MAASLEVPIDRLDRHGRGVASHAEQMLVCDGALPGEVVHITELKQHRNLVAAKAFTIVRSAEARVTPPCRYFGECGGCQLQQARYDAQLFYKQSYLKQCLLAIGDVRPEQWLPALAASPFHYRRRVRLGVRVINTDQIVIGFHRKHRSYLLDILACPVLDPRLHLLLEPLHQLVSQLSVRHRLPQIEMSAGELEVAIVIRHLLPLSHNDCILLRDFAEQHKALVFTQTGASEVPQPLQNVQATSLQYNLERHQIQLTFAATDFIQANARVNELLIDQLLAQLDVKESDVVLDLFCGIGNFSLPLARYTRQVVGVEGQTPLVERARYNAEHNGLRNVQFEQADLTQWEPNLKYNKLLLNPPREGAIDIIKRLPADAPEMIVYVSCMPRTLARDLRYLVHHRGYRLRRTGLVDMFPQTKHIETMVVLQRA